MPTYAEITADLLKDAAAFFKTLAEQNEAIRTDMKSNAAIYERMADTITNTPTGKAPNGDSFGVLAARLLRDTAVFYRKIGSQNAPIQEQMETNAGIYEQIAAAVSQDPLGILD
ncbi:MAG: hypothetical protein WBK77_01130 [Alphaproteobacteria bacterium]